MKSWGPMKPSVRSVSKSLRRAAAALDQFAPDDEVELPNIPQPPTLALDEYVEGSPSAQNAIDALAGWNMALPPEVGVIAGPAAFYCDPRIVWALEQFGPIEGRDILELGPLEASHTYMIEQRRPASILAIEANRLSFLRCLVVKELLGLKIAKFELGNFVPWLETAEQRFDLIVASGIISHGRSRSALRFAQPPNGQPIYLDALRERRRNAAGRRATQGVRWRTRGHPEPWRRSTLPATQLLGRLEKQGLLRRPL